MLYNRFKRIVRNQFAFLKDYGFNEKIVDYGAMEQSIVFEKGFWSISISRYQCITENYKKGTAVDVVIEYELNNSGIVVPTFGIVEFDKIGANLKDCDKLFGQDKVNQLNNDLLNANLKEQISVQANFLKENISSLKVDA